MKEKIYEYLDKKLYEICVKTKNFKYTSFAIGYK